MKTDSKLIGKATLALLYNRQAGDTSTVKEQKQMTEHIFFCSKNRGKRE